MKLSHIITEAAYPGNIGAMEVFHFYQKASPEEKEMFDQYLDQNEYDQAWGLIQDVTGVQLEPMGESLNERIATAYSDPIESITVSRGDQDMTFFVDSSKRVEDGWVFDIQTPSGNQEWHYDEHSKKLHYMDGHQVKYIGMLVGIDRKERSAA